MCRCRNKTGFDLLRCLAPPEGEYETYVKLSDSLAVVVNRSGVFIRRIVTDDTLPFVRTIDKRVSSPETLKAYGLSIDQLLCINLKNLEIAATHGSRTARIIINECFDFIDKIIIKCKNSI